ncbi:dihydroxyacetone kinase subunit L [Ruminiclostridium cellobioparum]|uniref:phosphoenolpyruvate--glycerone phosphotransferase n=1 Tax=Ruminiclostridium cellobioparum subsp. termitidis CT1112 TaxID=1195236 RepID=S0FQV7_RUMCE|nr:dihydroxyacetone kinase subunit L [Ruminiclostridium cellobioparum]EMS74222.1 Dihydroxyacetone kinase [Ruminiclostridium cellobioparum subsp. termitidis CT1112]
MIYTLQDVKNIINVSAEVALSLKELLTELDSRSGDGDLGITMEKSAHALMIEICKYEGKDIGEFLIKSAMSVNRAAPSTMGTLLSCSIMELGKEFKGSEEITCEQIVKVPAVIVDAIMKRGKANRGDKTILDALIPLADVLQASYARDMNLKLALKEAASAAAKGANRTKGMIAKVGRAKWIGERSRDYPDGGAVLCAVLIENLSQLD